MSRNWVRTALVIPLLVILAGLATSSCVPSSPSSSPSPKQLASVDSDLAWMDTVQSAWVVTHRHSWDADAEDDGIRVWVNLLDKNEEIVKYEKVQISVRIEIFATESKAFPWKPTRSLYAETAVLKNWYEDAFISGARGVKDIAWEEISPTHPSEQQEYGIIYVKVIMPNGEEYEARYDEARIKKP